MELGEPVSGKVKVRTKLIRRKTANATEQIVSVLYSSKKFLIVKMEDGSESMIDSTQQRNTPLFFHPLVLENE